MRERALHAVCVYCGSRNGHDPAYRAEAEAFGIGLARARIRLVYGAGDVGLMGALASAAIAAGGETLGVIPGHLVDREIAKEGLSQFVTTETMHERKKVMFMNAGAVALLPGGAGSLDEFFEVLTWAQLGLHQKPIILINVAGYWDPLIGLIEHVIGDGFADPSLKGLFSVVGSAASALDLLESHFRSSD
ncbi:MAG: TIGR00730 family Rossman fold protein [Pseudomonadota bacterium]